MGDIIWIILVILIDQNIQIFIYIGDRHRQQSYDVIILFV